AARHRFGELPGVLLELFCEGQYTVELIIPVPRVGGGAHERRGIEPQLPLNRRPAEALEKAFDAHVGEALARGSNPGAPGRNVNCENLPTRAPLVLASAARPVSAANPAEGWV